MKDLPAKAIIKPLASALHDAVFKDDLERVTQLLNEGADWREADNDKKIKSKGKSIYSPTMNALEVAVVGHHLKIVELILKQAVAGKDDVLLQKAFHQACQFNYISLKEFHQHHPVLVKNEFLKALKDNNANLLITLARELFLDDFDKIKDEQGNHILHVIAKAGTKENLDEILKLKAGVSRLVNLPNAEGNTPLHIAAGAYNRDVIIALTDNGALVGKPNLQGDTSLHIAAAHTNSNAVERLCKAGYLQNRESHVHQVSFDILTKNKKNLTANDRAKSLYITQTLDEQEVYRSIEKGIELIYQGNQLALEKFIRENSGILSKVDEQGDTLLHHAFIAFRQTGKSCLLAVLNAKPNVNIKNKKGQTPLLLAASLGAWFVEEGESHRYTVLCLRDLGANLSETDSIGYTALHYAAIDDAPWSTELLVRYSNVYVDTVTSTGIAPIHLAAYHGKKETFDVLLRNEADIHIVAYPNALPQLLAQPTQTAYEITPLLLAMHSNAKAIVNTIFDDFVDKKKASILEEVRNLDGSTLLHYFAENKDFYRFKQALRLGVDPFIANINNYLPFHSACAMGDLDIVKHYVEVLAPSQSYWSQLKGRKFDINDLPEKGINALTLAGPHQTVVQYLKAKGAKAVSAQEERQIGGVRSVISFYNSQSEYSGQLGSTRTNQLLNLGRIVGSTMLTAYKGSVGMAVAAAHQALLYNMPFLMRKSSDFYYYYKPTIHNKAPRFINSGFDLTATLTSNVTHSVFKVLDWADIASNPARRAAGFVTGVGMARLASRYTDSRELQGAAYFFGREMGMFAVEAYQQHGRLLSEDFRNKELSKAYDLWTSLLGKTVGESFMWTVHQLSEMHQDLLESVGWFEHSVLSYTGDTLDSICKGVFSVGLEILTQQIDLALSITGVSPLAVYSTIQSSSRYIYQLREQVLNNIEHLIAENLLPDSQHRDVTLQYLLLNQTVLLTQKLLTKKVDQTTQECNVRTLEEERDILDVSAIEEKSRLEKRIEIAKNNLLRINQECDALTEKISQSQNAYTEIWKKTPKGALEFKCKEAQQNLFNGQINIEGLKLKYQFYKERNAEEAVLAEINTQLQEAEKALVDLQAALEVTESDWLKLANPVEIKQQPKQKEEMGKQIEAELTSFKHEQEQVYKMYGELLTSTDKFGEDWVDLRNAQRKVELAKSAFDTIDLRIKAIDRPPFFNSRNTVEDALAQYPHDRDQVVKLILEKIVATGMISLADANARIKNSLEAAFKSHHRKADELNKVVTHHFNMLGQEYRRSLVQQRIQLQKINDAAVSELKVASDKYEVQKSIVQQNKLAYEAVTGGKSADGLIIEQIFNQPNNWDMVHNSDGIKTTLTLLGQSNMTVNAMIDGGGPSSQGHRAASLAKSLVDYKYLFITAPNIDVRLQEIDTLATDLVKQTLDPNHILVLKQNMDLQIAQQLLDNSKSLASQLRASSISNHLQNGFRYNEGQTFIFETQGASLRETLTTQFEAQDEVSAAQAIATVLQNQTQAISIAEAGVYTSPVVVPHVPSKPHGLNRWWDHAKEEVKHYGKKVLKITGGVNTNLTPDGVSAGFTYGNQFRVMQFRPPKAPPLFTIAKTPPSPVVIGSQAGVTHSEAASNESFVPYPARVINNIPHVVAMPWESEPKLPVQPLMFSAQAQVAAQSTMVSTRSQVQARSQAQAQTQAQRVPTFQWEAAPSPWLPVRFPVPQNAAFNLRDFTRISAHKGIDVEPSIFKSVVDNTRSAVAYLSDPAKQAEIQLDPANFPKTYAAYLGVCEVEQVNLRLVVFNAVKGFFDEVGGYIGADLYRATHDEQTVTVQKAREIGQAVVATSAYLSDRQNRILLGGAVVSHVRDEFGRFVNGEPTRTGTALEGWINEQGQRPAEELVTGGIKELVYLVAGEAFLRGVGYSSAQAYRLLKDNPVNMGFFKEFGLKGPLLEPAKLYSGWPIDNLLLFNKSVLDNTTSKVLDGQFYPKDKLTSLVNYLDRRGVSVYGIPSDKDPYFIAFPNGTSPQIFWPATPTVLQVKHELSHYLDYKNLGFDAYAKLSRYDREQMVLDRLQSNRLWIGLNEIEKQFSIDYVERLKTQKKVIANDK